ncbi:hypothetical protein ABZ714_17575 [Streptomyces sp. NPDC006798]|uniref:hypothetical protein n=1 Tax=Streptomyces sp. NPDC006798 TaxID=3155462 RepID=UPI0033C0BEE5
MSNHQRCQRVCDLCGEPGADACVRMASGAPGERQRPVFGHAECARGRGIVPLYRLVTAGGVR